MVDHAADGDAGWYLGEVNTYDAVVLDLELPRLSGLDVLRKWRAAGRKSEPGQYFQGLIQIAAANLKRFVGLPHAANNLWRRGLEQFNRIPSRYMGLDVLVFTEDVRAYFELSKPSPPLIRLMFTDKVPRSDRS